MIADLHIHTRCSRDSLMDPARVVHVARTRGLAGIAVTDHDTIRGGILAREANRDKDFQVVVGAEIKTEYGDVLGLFLEQEIVTRKFDDVVGEIHAQGGLAVLAHPYRRYPSPERLAGRVDLIEGFNSRSRRQTNALSMTLGRISGKGTVGGSDAHVYAEIGRGVTVCAGEEIEEALRAGRTAGGGRESNYYLVHGLSCSIERLKGLAGGDNGRR
ncbi:MAG: PHP domain-containing protein [Methanomicrobiaceae archaeon]|uniref:PHP domain-containing protein n=1 Tax=Methanoculleus sp. TaxID=90427 RepID=UPI00320D6920|nr:PHP domain-containing protein [Methanomicrobiaceae archaeon]